MDGASDLGHCSEAKKSQPMPFIQYNMQFLPKSVNRNCRFALTFSKQLRSVKSGLKIEPDPTGKQVFYKVVISYDFIQCKSYKNYKKIVFRKTTITKKT